MYPMVFFLGMLTSSAITLLVYCGLRWRDRCRARRELLENIILGYVATFDEGLSLSRLRRYVWPDRDGVLPGLSIGEFYVAVDRLEEEGRCVSVATFGPDERGRSDRLLKLGANG